MASGEPHTVTLAGANLDFSTAGYPTLLAAALASGVELPYECASGGCGTCKVRLVEGTVESLWSDATGLSDRDRRKGDRILTCQSVATSDCVVKAPLVHRAAPSRLVRTKATVTRIDELTRHTRRIVFTPEESVSYLAGQFIMVEFPDGVRRAYSMSRRYSDDDSHAGWELEVIVRAKPGGAATEWLFGDLGEVAGIIIEGPYGMAHLQSPPDRPIVAIAGGSGLGPMLAVAEQAVVESPDRSVHLYVGSRVPGDRICLGELSALGDAGVAVHHAVEHDPPPGCRPGLVGDVVDADWNDLSNVDVYLCGPAGMVDACLAQLVRTGKAAADRVFFDRFQ